ncbi:kinesin-like protein KIN-12E isoform X1 [Ananas comosus]|uniref:Kinesin-like protein KIN-12E isoform X1 n=1 Tax=Ananas comosus TaxID=4615 RepID=A0A6P5EF06_ANACO|nr:kinesin-like protein KIN-12E isoform X1 [Ananas comosus]
MGLSAGIGEVVRGARDGSGDGSTPYDPIGGGDGAATVMIRIRPINKVESALHGYNRCLIQESSQTLTWTGHPETRFTFDHVACEDTTQVNCCRRNFFELLAYQRWRTACLAIITSQSQKAEVV